jgi:hypothetical protein
MKNPDKPRDRPTVPEVAPLIRAIYEREGGGCGCCLHIVTDDYNCEQSSIDFCLEYARERGHSDCIRVAEMLAAMTITQRTKASRTWPQFRADPPSRETP